MSNCSGLLGDYQGSWTCVSKYRPLVQAMFKDMRGFVIDITADLATDYYGNQFMFSVINGRVQLGGMQTRISSDGHLCILDGRGHVMLLYGRTAETL
jgi:hypothetical protein